MTYLCVWQQVWGQCDNTVCFTENYLIILLISRRIKCLSSSPRSCKFTESMVGFPRNIVKKNSWFKQNVFASTIFFATKECWLSKKGVPHKNLAPKIYGYILGSEAFLRGFLVHRYWKTILVDYQFSIWFISLRFLWNYIFKCLHIMVKMIPVTGYRSLHSHKQYANSFQQDLLYTLYSVQEIKNFLW